MRSNIIRKVTAATLTMAATAAFGLGASSEAWAGKSSAWDSSAWDRVGTTTKSSAWDSSAWD
ncbi:MAG: hypothetical protein H0U51_08050 [Propionibacteriales bacterium]|nr:hypothetical protein [Propionibacteriales bacterium]